MTRSLKQAVALAIAALLVAGFLSTPAQAVTLPGTNGIVVVETATGLVAVDPVAATRTTLAGFTANDRNPHVNPAGNRVALNVNGNIFLADFPSGNNRVQVTQGGGFTDPAFSPDGSQLVIDHTNGLVLASTAGPFPVPTTTMIGTQAGDAEPDFSPDGQFIVFHRTTGLFRVNANNTGGRTGPLTGTNVAGVDSAVVAPSGSVVYFDSNSGIRQASWPNGGNVSLLTGSVANDFDPTPSPDGTKVAFETANGTFTVNANGTGGRGTLPGSIAGDADPMWARTPAASIPPADPIPPATTGTITGNVTQAAAPSSGGFGFGGGLFGGLFGGGSSSSSAPQPVAGATVTAAGLSATTDAAGNYTIANVPSGAQTVSASLNGTACGSSASVDVPAGGSATQNFTCPAAQSSGSSGGGFGGGLFGGLFGGSGFGGGGFGGGLGGLFGGFGF